MKSRQLSNVVRVQSRRNCLSMLSKPARLLILRDVAISSGGKINTRIYVMFAVRRILIEPLKASRGLERKFAT